MSGVATWSIKLRLVIFAAAAFIVGAWGCGVLWQSGYTTTLPVGILLPAALVVEAILYALVRGSRSGLGAFAAIVLGLVARASMAAATAALANESQPFAVLFVRFYASAWVGMVLQIAMAGLLVWFIADLVPAIAAVSPVRVATPPQDDRRRLLDELLRDTGIRPEVEQLEQSPEAAAREPSPAEDAGDANELEIVLEPVEPAREGAQETPPADTAPQDVTSAADQETSELEAVTESAPAAEVMGWAVAEVVRSATSVADVRPLAQCADLPVQIIGNLPEEVQPSIACRGCLAGAGALAILCEHGLVGQPLFAVGLFRAGGLVVVPASEAIVWLRHPAPANLGQLAVQARNLAKTLDAQWPAVVPELAPAPSSEGVELSISPLNEWAASAGVQAIPCRVEGTGLLAVLASAGCEHTAIASFAAAVWQNWSEIGRSCGHGGLRRLLVAAEEGSIGLGATQLETGDHCLIVRVAPQAPLGTVAAEIERIIALCSPKA